MDADGHGSVIVWTGWLRGCQPWLRISIAKGSLKKYQRPIPLPAPLNQVPWVWSLSMTTVLRAPSLILLNPVLGALNWRWNPSSAWGVNGIHITKSSRKLSKTMLSVVPYSASVCLKQNPTILPAGLKRYGSGDHPTLVSQIGGVTDSRVTMSHPTPLHTSKLKLIIFKFIRYTYRYFVKRKVPGRVDA